MFFVRDHVAYLPGRWERSDYWCSLVWQLSCTVFTANDMCEAMLFFNCRLSTVPKCGGSGPCLSGGELGGVCCQRQVHVLSVGASLSRMWVMSYVNSMALP